MGRNYQGGQPCPQLLAGSSLSWGVILGVVPTPVVFTSGHREGRERERRENSQIPQWGSPLMCVSQTIPYFTRLFLGCAGAQHHLVLPAPGNHPAGKAGAGNPSSSPALLYIPGKGGQALNSFILGAAGLLLGTASASGWEDLGDDPSRDGATREQRGGDGSGEREGGGRFGLVRAE